VEETGEGCELNLLKKQFSSFSSLVLNLRALRLTPRVVQLIDNQSSGRSHRDVSHWFVDYGLALCSSPTCVLSNPIECRVGFGDTRRQILVQPIAKYNIFQ